MKRVAITDESIGIYQLLGARAWAVPTPKVYAYDVVKSNDKSNSTTLLHVSIPSFHWGNEAEILIIAILGENELFCHFKGEEMFRHFMGERNFNERLGDVFRGKYYFFSTRKIG